MRLLTPLASFLPWLVGCTLATDAGDRKIVDAMDLDFTLLGMSGPHVAGETLDVAIVVLQEENEQALRGRARVVLPRPPESGLSTERIVMKRVLLDGPQSRALFYVDSDNDLHYDEMDGEHVWQENVPESGELTFRHANVFQEFDENKPKKIGGDVVFELSPLANTFFGTACFARA